jgi:RimJ/RimL family protein N-acetyltransferase
MDTWLEVAPPDDVDAGAVRLRRWRPADAEAQAALVNANLEHLRPWMAWAQQPTTTEVQHGFVVRLQDLWERRSDFGYVVMLPDGALIGGMGLHTRQGPGTLEIGYWIAEEHTGRGYCTAGARALTDTAFALPGVERLEIRCDRANLASASVPRKLGYRLVDEIERPATAPADTGWGLIWSIGRKDWERTSGR